MSVKVAVEHGKYVARVTNHGEVLADRGDIVGWVRNPQGSKMWIAILHELADARRLLADINSGGPVFRDRIAKHFEQYGVRREDCRGSE